MPYFLTLELPSISPLISPRLSQSVISRHDVVITFDDEVYDMVLLGESNPDYLADVLPLVGFQ